MHAAPTRIGRVAPGAAEPGDFVSAPSVRWLFTSRAAGVPWLVVRVLLGLAWLRTGWDKVFGPASAAWMEDGAAVRGFVQRAVAASRTGEHPQVAYGWYVDFLRFVGDHSWFFAKLVAFGEVAIGIGLVLGAFTGIAAFCGVVLNFLFVFGGVAGENPAYLIAGILLVLAWRNAGWYGLDRFLLPAFGTPWQRHHPWARGRVEMP